MLLKRLIMIIIVCSYLFDSDNNKSQVRFEIVEHSLDRINWSLDKIDSIGLFFPLDRINWSLDKLCRLINCFIFLLD